jgi:hypothetical protein
LRQALSATLTLAILMRFAAAGPDTASVTTQIVGIALGTQIELRLKSKERIRGARGAVSSTSFVLVDAHAAERQIAFDDIISVKQVSGQSHYRRNILICTGIMVAAVAVVGIAYALALGKLGHST